MQLIDARPLNELSPARMLRNGLWMAIGAGLLVAAGMLISACAVFPLVLVLVGVVFAVQAGIRDVIRRTVRESGSQPPAEVIEQLHSKIEDAYPRYAVAALATGLWERGVRGAAIRFAPENERKAVQAIADPFEPLPLNAANAQLMSAAHGYEGDAAHEESKEDDRRALRNRSLPAILLPIPIAIGFLLAGGDIEILFIGLIGTIAGSVASRSAAGKGPPGVDVVPGGLLLRRSLLRLGAEENYVFRARNGILCISHEGRLRRYTVIDGSRTHRAVVTPPEAELLLRCWLSPLAPPTLEQIRDLA